MAKIALKKCTGSGTLRPFVWHPSALERIKGFSEKVKVKIGYLLYLLQKGEVLQIPQARSMSSFSAGVQELRTKDRDGIYRVFYLTKFEDGIYVFHAFQKKTEKTPGEEIRLARKRLKELVESQNEQE